MNCEVGKYQNPADVVIKLAQVPELCNINIDFESVLKYYETFIKPRINREINHDTNKYMNVSTNFDRLGKDRKSSSCKQFAAIF